MARLLATPRTDYEPPPLPDLTDKAERERLSGPAVRTFFNILKHWKLPDETGLQLLQVSNGTYYNWKRGKVGALNSDQLLRISYVIGIFKALNILHSEELADRWVTMPNKNPLFKGASPISVIAKGGIPALQAVRRLLDARRGGA